MDILVNNATGWLADTFSADPRDALGRNLARAAVFELAPLGITANVVHLR